MPITNILQPISIPPASTSNNGLMTAADKQKLDGLVTATKTDNSATPTLTLANNTIYSCINAAITMLTISGVNRGFEYAAIEFNSGSTAASVDIPSGWVCIGEDCSNNDFIPVADKCYSMAIRQRFDGVRVYVMEG